ncbi:MAG: hypothetical protein H6818_09265 [Phycisphaerales bacterium]|nr:hypothetical protein [Phycisphaerales bacterium]
MGWLEVLGQIGVAGSLGGALAWAGKSVVNHWLSGRLAAHDKEIEKLNALAIEERKADLARLGHEHEIRFRSIHERQAEVIADTYGKLERLRIAVEFYTQDITFEHSPSSEQRINDVIARWKEFSEYFFPHSIFFPQSLERQVSQTANQINALAKTYKKLQSPRSDRHFEHLNRRCVDLDNSIPQLLGSMKSEFRRILGVREEQTDSIVDGTNDIVRGAVDVALGTDPLIR